MATDSSFSEFQRAVGCLLQWRTLTDHIDILRRSHNEVTFRERKYYPNEQGVRTDLVRHGHQPSRAGRASPVPSATPPQPQPRPIDVARTLEGDAKDSHLYPAPSQRVPSRSASPMPAPRSPLGLQEGDTVYWHYLISAGEMATPVDPRSRKHTSLGIGR